MEFGAALKAFRNKAGLTQDQLSELADVSYKQIQSYEQGRSTPQRVTVFRLATAFGLTVEQLTAGPTE